MRYILQILASIDLLGCQLSSNPPSLQLQQEEIEKREIQIQGKICTEVGCEDILSLNFDPPISYPGNYIFRFSYVNGSRICEYHIPTDDKDTCGNDIVILKKNVNSHTPKTNVIEPISGITISMAPKTFTLNIIRNGKKILTQTHSPIYSEYSPNGRDCPPTCKSGDQQIRISNNFKSNP